MSDTRSRCAALVSPAAPSAAATASESTPSGRTKASKRSILLTFSCTSAFWSLFILTIPCRARQRWAWWACSALLIAFLGYALTFGAHDSAILPRSLIGAIGLPVLLIASAPAFFRRDRADEAD